MALLGGIGGCDLIGESISLEISFEGLKTQVISSLLFLFPTYSSVSELSLRSGGHAATCCHTSSPGTLSTLEPEVKSTLKSLSCLDHGVLSQQQVQYYFISIFATS